MVQSQNIYTCKLLPEKAVKVKLKKNNRISRIIHSLNFSNSFFKRRIDLHAVSLKRLWSDVD